jgi:uncharacterized protein YdeI (YjbR/CyaY-like superfamily)
MNTESVDAYLRDGCGRCVLYQTPQCKVHLWPEVLVALRGLVRQTPLVEEMKWGSPCYTLDGKNVAMIGAFKECASLSFFQGVALRDPAGVLVAAGPNSRYARLLKFRTASEVHQQAAVIADLLNQAVALAKDGVRLHLGPPSEPIPAELEERLESDPALAAAFFALTPGRRRSHILHISGAKQAETRARRVEKCAPDILEGRGFNEGMYGDRKGARTPDR